MKKIVLIKKTEEIIYRKLLKEYPGGLSFNVLRKKIPKSLRRFIPQAINRLYNKGTLSKKGNRYNVNQVMK